MYLPGMVQVRIQYSFRRPPLEPMNILPAEDGSTCCTAEEPVFREKLAVLPDGGFEDFAVSGFVVGIIQKTAKQVCKKLWHYNKNEKMPRHFSDFEFSENHIYTRVQRSVS